ncbi:hypothetical protein [Metallibacterium scheffleri]|uniref:hypothetical protein n=1 Tax=Metallibacterium scheffleri TaxID=993689 RepID=UPI0010A0A539|nr:hypothetical protein [Metallibacterium scheffleri]
MKYFFSIVGFAVIGIAIAACSQEHVACQWDANATKSWPLKLKDAKNDAKKAYLRGDFRFIGINGYTLQVPGISYANIKNYDYGTVIVPGTSDAICDAKQKHFVENATLYAKKYNQEILYLLKRGGD